MQPFAPQARALQDAEAVLLVDDDQTELLEPDVAFDQRVRADDEVNRAGFDLGQLLAPRGRGRRAGQQRDAEPRRLQQPRDVEEVLLGQDFGRRHERDLEAVLHRDQRREQRDDRLPRPDVALQQPVHRLRTLQVVDDFLERLPLAAGELERQHAPRRLADAIVHRRHDGLALGRGRPPPRRDARLKQKRLFEDQPPLRRRREPVQLVDRRVGRRKVRREQRRAPRRHIERAGERRPAAGPADPAAASAARRARAAAASSASRFRSARRRARCGPV